MTRITTTFATITIGLALLGCDEKTPDAPKVTGAGAGVGIGGSMGADPSVVPTQGGDRTASARPMPGSGGMGNTGSATPDGDESATGRNNVAGGAHSTTQPTTQP